MPNITQNPIIASQNDKELLIEQWIKCRLSGDHSRASQLQQVIKSLSNQSGNARVAPAAGVPDWLESDDSPRSGNTGGTFDGDITDKSGTYEFADSQLKFKVDGLTKRDWISVSFNSLDDDDHQDRVFNELSDIFTECHITIRTRSKGLYGYSSSAMLVHHSDSGSDANVGMLAWSDKQGLFFELSGLGCTLVDSMITELYQLCHVNLGRMGRYDVAADLPSEYCLGNAITVPLIGVDAYNGLYRSKFAPDTRQTIQQAGDWSDLTFGFVSPASYNPLEHSQRGLTLYIGTSKSDNQIVVYEKGKQLLGCVPDKDYERFQKLSAMSDLSQRQQKEYARLIDESGCEPEYLDHRGWVRVERRFRRGNNKKNIPLEMLLDPDSAFVQDFQGLESLLQDLSVHVTGENLTVAEFKRSRQEVEKSILLTRKVYWGRMHVGRLVRTLYDIGRTDAEIMHYLLRENGLDDFIFDIDE